MLELTGTCWHLLALAAAGTLASAFVRHARAADLPRVDMGIASGQPHAAGMVLWTRLSGPDLPPQVDVAWALAEDEAFTRVAARGTEQALAGAAHSVHTGQAQLRVVSDARDAGSAVGTAAQLAVQAVQPGAVRA